MVNFRGWRTNNDLMMLKIVVLVFYILGIIQSGVGQIIQDGQCDPGITLEPSFNIDQFAGKWFEVARSDVGVRGSDCSHFEFNIIEDGIEVLNPGVNANFVADRNGTATVVNGTARLTLSLSYPDEPFDFWVIRTDHANFAIAINCQNISPTQRSVNVWQLGRATTYPNDLMPAIMNTALQNAFGITLDQLRSIDHSEDACYVLPIIEPGDPIILPGQCDDNINVVQNFEAERFLGVWHEIASYVSENSLNLCARAEYSLENGVIKVENSQVVNETLLSIFGNATITTTDGSARLSVTLDVGGITFTRNLAILATDYERYAVSYTCENLTSDTKRVYSWILGRSRQLSTEAQAAVNQVIESEVTLNNQYYRQTDQSDEACFFFPEYVPDTPVVFRGLCDQNIPAVANFDPERYQGIWHDIESYYSAFQTGDCRNAEYELADGFVAVLNTQVIDQTLDSVVGEARLVSTDGSGKLDVTFPIAGTNLTVTTNYWILDTDYISYSLVYSCTNLNENERQVWTWKLSRTKTLTQQASNAIDSVISTIPVLDQQYYQSVDQTPDACFFFPEPRPGVPVVFPGQCSNSISVMQNFNLNLFSGTWHEIEAYPKEQQQGQCISHEYTSGQGNTLDLQSSQITDQFLGVTNGTLSFTSTDGSARMNININVDGETITIPFWILDTDYTDYALAYSCVEQNSDFRGIYSWKLSRTKQLSQNAYTNIDRVISEIQVLGQHYYESIDQSDEACFFLPELAPGEPIILVGQCDPNLNAVANFDAVRYAGTWHLIESYPSDFQNGTCNRAQYTLGDSGTVEVLNSQVVDQGLKTVEGSAVVASTDGSGKLLVTFPGAPTPSDYWILDTDYISYSIVYSCKNINTEQRRVWSWKMSRTRELSDAATTAINAVVNSVNVLNNRYFYDIDQTEEGCFYFPEPNPDATVVFPGRCDQNISVVPNFNVARYLGIWHNIELYPSQFQYGTCSNAQYDLILGEVRVVNSQVVNQTLDSITGRAVIASVDASGKLDVTFPVEGTNQTVTLSLWILDTDYESYSLAYSCLENGDYREVWSWKLSRGKQLSDFARERINTAMAAVQVLEDRYFLTVDQSDVGCFYFPEPSPGVPVKFPGRCSNDIPVMQNLNLAQLEGNWYEVSAYPSGQDLGECTTHVYSSSAANTLDLLYGNVKELSFNVVNGSLAFAPGNNNNDGRLLITVSHFDSELQIPFWILDMQYGDYALAYGCVDQGITSLDRDFRIVYSWKLSRTKQLSPSATAAIDNVISTVDVLRQDYYEQVDLSDEACFFLPDTAPGQVVVFPGQCDPNISVVQNFSAADYLGRWYLIESYPSDFQTGTCNDARYSLAADGTVDVFNTQVVNQTFDTVSGSAVASADGTGKLLVTFPGATQPSDYWILDTDYTSYSLVYSCANINSDQRAVWSWKMSRTQSLSSTAISNMDQVIASVNVLADRYYKQIDHSPEGCFYFPEPQTLTPVRFRGRCDETIGVVQNFDAVRYMGLWHLIESYPSPFQNGTCNNAQYYSLGDEGVLVYNTQVIDQSLDSVSGLAVVVSTDGSAILNVSFPIAGTDDTTQTPYWVLATDYVSYSLVYTCVELDEEFRYVWSWKMSRTKQLSGAAVSAINNVTEGIQVLDELYYEPVDQSREGCFYFPEPQPGVPVVFPGHCENIDVVQNFNMAAFEGTWHEIEAYPKPQQPGQCVRHQYTAGADGSLELQSSQVSDLALGVSNGTLTSASTDGSARLSITINAGGEIVTIPFWIVATDYTDYALAYSCVNINEDFRGVYSWKLSRARQLSPSSAAAIDTAISTVDVLQQNYYEEVDQSDEACFFLPDMAPGEVVVFPGQCDPNITVVQNFSAADYLGRWYLIESYPSNFQTGTCNDARYSLAADGTVDVFNTQVVNQTFDTVSGSAVASADGTGKLLVTFPGATQPSDYWILDTDYTSYSLVYSCANINSDQRAVWSWKMSRTQSLSSTAISNMDQVISSVNVLANRYYNQIDHSPEGCFYFPEPQTLTPVRFRGRCDETIGVVQNFDAVRYMGLWHLIESYPSPFQNGTCNNAQYSLGDDGVLVYNTQVIDQSLDSVSGLAVVVSTDGSAILNVSFPIAGTDNTTQTPYWVLATDYDSYSLVYTCVELDEEFRYVWSWKMSRTKQLSGAAVSAINNVTEGIQVLDELYYEPVDQSREGCFYFPEPQSGVPVVFPGQCENIDVVQNFNIAAFEGTWHEIEAYPKPQQPGQCVRHAYTAGADGSLELQSSQVSDLALSVSNGTLTSTSTDGSARLSITINAGGEIVTIPFWIVATDYTDYALAYSCVNMNEDFRGVYSWKLSRSKALSVAGQAAIANAMSNIEIIDDVYFEPIDQSDEACFFLPALAPGEPVVFPGQCDLNISVVQEFDAARYLGRWRMIESYATEFQGGDCIEASYSLADDGTVDVYNTQVIDQLLDSINGTAVASADGTGKLLVTFPGSPEPSNYWILATDYDSYSLVYSCRNINAEQRRVWAWKLSRDRSLSADAVTAINSVVDTINVLNAQYFEAVQHSDDACFYYPPADGSAVVFRGQCDENIAVVTDFDPSRYVGEWFDIESYPQSFQDGTCPTAEYTLDGDVVRVRNTQVRAQELVEVLATAVLTGNGTEAKLTVTFPGDTPVEMPYWVLATDYYNYSLVYSCQNVNEELRRVTSWKLSRTQYLSAESSNLIAEAIESVPVLDQQYYESREHSETDCFFYPDNNGGPVILDGQCEDQVNVTDNFDPNRFGGIWYEVARFPSELQEGACASNELVFDQGSLTLTTRIVNDEALTTMTGPVTVAADGTGILTVDLSNGADRIAGTVYVLDVDYDEFALLYSCRNFNNSHLQAYSWKLSRNAAGLSETANERIDSIVAEEANLFFRYYDDTEQDNDSCFYYPQFDPLPDVITLPGPCNPNIRGVPNFDAERYLGQWFEIEKYPQAWQTGQCPRAQYSSAVGGVSVLNTQVVNRTLLTQAGSAVPATTDGSGQLTVTFDVEGVSNVANYYILATDYDNYALVYSCRDLDNGDRQVSSWKLSRSRTLSAEANRAFNEVVSSTQGLLQDYYTTTDQSPEACFYVPELDPERPVRFRGTCDNINGQANFDMQRYLGWWHEVNSYPTGNDTGSCLSTQYEQIGNQYQFVNTQVFGLTGQVNRGTVRVDNSKLIKTFPDGQTQENWVLATDYLNYALLLSCERYDDEYVQVWSSMQSKTRNLTEADEEAIAAVIASNDYLSEDLYLSIDLSDEACFHYPEQLGQRVRLPGQCDQNIPVQAGFDIVRYSGVWYQIERYPYPEVSDNSTCIGTRYTYNEGTGVVTVQNWEVLDGELRTIEGQATVGNNTSSLEVVLPVPGSEDATSTAELYVLTTDYASYALVYTCENMNQFEKEVVAFKLSRTRSLPSAANTAINNYMASRDELHQPLFLTVEQNDECQEPNSSFLVKSSIVLVLICYAIQMLM